MDARLWLPSILALAGAAAPGLGHHSWSGVYNSEDSITIRGVVTEFLFMSPHLALKVDVPNADGTVAQWTVEWGSPRRFLEAGHDKDTLRPGDEVVITGDPAWEADRKSVRMRSLTRASDGFKLGDERRRR